MYINVLIWKTHISIRKINVVIRKPHVLARKVNVLMRKTNILVRKTNISIRKSNVLRRNTNIWMREMAPQLSVAGAAFSRKRAMVRNNVVFTLFLTLFLVVRHVWGPTAQNWQFRSNHVFDEGNQCFNKENQYFN